MRQTGAFSYETQQRDPLREPQLCRKAQRLSSRHTTNQVVLLLHVSRRLPDIGDGRRYIVDQDRSLRLGFGWQGAMSEPIEQHSLARAGGTHDGYQLACSKRRGAEISQACRKAVQSVSLQLTRACLARYPIQQHLFRSLARRRQGQLEILPSKDFNRVVVQPAELVIVDQARFQRAHLVELGLVLLGRRCHEVCHGVSRMMDDLEFTRIEGRQACDDTYGASFEVYISRSVRPDVTGRGSFSRPFPISCRSLKHFLTTHQARRILVMHFGDLLQMPRQRPGRRKRRVIQPRQQHI